VFPALDCRTGLVQLSASGVSFVLDVDLTPPPAKKR
jgi:hypothetical protein